MAMKDRIRERRTALGVSQEYVAARLNVSRQAVSKWESGKSAPDTANLIALAALLGVSVEWLAAEGSEQGTLAKTMLSEPVVPEPVTAVFEPARRGMKARSRKTLTHKQKLVVFSALLLLLAAALLLTVHLAPVDWDAGACGGGFGTYIFDKFSPHLTGLYGVSVENGYHFEALRGTHEVTWSGRTIHVEFDVQYKDNTRGIVTDRVHFCGKRVWIETFRWTLSSSAQQAVESLTPASCSHAKSPFFFAPQAGSGDVEMPGSV